jgi:pimeloyl-ACP methyl ester carboxylesterase
MAERTANGVRLHYELDGPEGANVLVLSNGLMSTASRAYQVPALARQIPHAAFAVIPDAGHALCWEATLAFNNLVLGFLAQQEGGSLPA